MELILKIYSIFYAFILVSNVVVMFKWRMFKWKVFLYEAFSATYLIFAIFAYFSESLRAWGGAYLGLPVIAIICIDLYTTIWHDPNDFFELPGEEKITTGDIETAKAVAVALAAPGYICGALLFFEEIRDQVS